MGDDDRPVPSTLIKNKRGDVNKRLTRAENLRRGSNVPSNMDQYLAGFIDAHYTFKDDLSGLASMMAAFDSDVREKRESDTDNVEADE